MPDMKSLLEHGPRGALSEGALRFDELARNVKSQQIAQSQGAAQRKVSPITIASPDEEWARRFMTRAIGPIPELSAIGGWVPPPPVPKVSMDFVLPRDQDVVPSVSESFSPGAPMGRSIGRPEAPQRSWLGRMLRGD